MKKIIVSLIVFFLFFTTNCTGRKSATQKQIQDAEIENLQKTHENTSVKNEVQENKTSTTDFKGSKDETGEWTNKETTGSSDQNASR